MIEAGYDERRSSNTWPNALICSCLRPRWGPLMARRVLKVELRSHATANGRERLARAVSWMIDRAPSRRIVPSDENESVDEKSMELFLEQGNQ